MAINIKNIEDAIQRKAYAVDSSTSVNDLSDMVEAALLITGGLREYADSAELPTAATSNDKIAFVKDQKSIRFNNGKIWAGTASGEVTTPGPSGAGTPVFAGTNYGYSMGGGSSPYTQNIDQYSFSSDGDATNVGAMDNPDTNAVWSGSGGGSTTHGYHIGGSPVSPFSSPIFKFPYTSGTPIADTGNDVVANQMHRYGHYEMCGDRTNIYVVGGYRGPSYPTLGNKNTILSFAASSDGSTITDYGDLTQGKRLLATQSSDTHGYTSGGYTSTGVNVIEKWPFAGAANATDVGDLTVVSNINNGHSSSTHGYSTGAPSGIEKFSFSTDGNATDVADLYSNKGYSASASSDVSGYLAGGNPSTTTIQKFSFTSDANGTLVGALAFARRANAGTHY